MSTENQRPNDRELENFLTGDSEISRAYRRIEKTAVPTELDHAVLRMAHAENKQSARLIVFRWRVPLALAATVLLSLGSLQLIREDTVARRAAMFEEQVLPMSDASVEAPALTMQPQSRPEPAAAAEIAPQLAAPSMKQERQKNLRERNLIGDAPAAKAESLPPAEAKKSPLRMMAPATPPPAALQSESESGSLQGAAAAEPMPERLYKESDRARTMDAVNLAPAASADERRTKSKPDTSDVEAWLQRIRGLRDQPDLDAARQQLKQFTDAFPDYVLPEDLRPLLN